VYVGLEEYKRIFGDVCKMHSGLGEMHKIGVEFEHLHEMIK
jgi:hypothetical protein